MALARRLPLPLPLLLPLLLGAERARAQCTTCNDGNGACDTTSGCAWNVNPNVLPATDTTACPAACSGGSVSGGTCTCNSCGSAPVCGDAEAERTCTAFSATFPTTPTGYAVSDASATTVLGVGLSCDTANHYSGTPVLTCNGATFSEPSGCELQAICGLTPA